MAEQLSILLELANVQRMLNDLRAVQNGVASVNRAVAAGNAGGGGAAGSGGGGGAAAAANLALLGSRIAFVAGILGTLGHVVRVTTEQLREMSDLRLFTGAGARQAAGAAALGGALGMSPSQIAAEAIALRQRIATDPMARLGASQAGLGPILPREFGGPSDVQVWVDMIHAIRRATTDQAAHTLAVRTGTEELLRFRYATAAQVRNAQALAEAQARFLGPDAQARSARAATWWEQQKQDFRLGAGILKDLALRAGERLGILPGADRGMGRAADAIRQNTQALNNNTVAIGQLRAIFGGGERARGALPAGLRGELLRKQMEGDALKLGAFKL